MKRVVTFKIDEETLEKLDLLAKKTRRFRSEIIREAIQKYLYEYERKDPRVYGTRRIKVYV